MQAPLVLQAIRRAARRLLESGVPASQPNVINGMTPISFAVAHSAFDCARLLVEEYGADPGVEDFNGESALLLAAVQQDAESLRVLLENYVCPRGGDFSERTRALERAIIARNK